MGITILDGGMGGEIKTRLEGAATGLWSASALKEAPDLVVEIHKEYIDAGARIIITNSYSCVPSYLGKEGMEDRYAEFAALAGRLAQRAVAESGKDVKIAASIPPLEESYRPDLVPAAEEALPIYEGLVKALYDYVDMYFCETMSCADEARNAASQAVRFGGGKPVYVSWTLDETPGAGLRSGESVTEAFQKIADLEVAGYMFNCTHPEAIEVALTELRGLTDKPLGCYPNKLNKVPKDWTLDSAPQHGRRDDLSEEYFVEMSLRCIRQGASIIGGCCGIGPSYIESLSTAVAGKQER